MRALHLPLGDLRRTAMTALIVAVVETPVALAIGGLLGYAAGPRRPATMTLDTSRLPAGTTVRIEQDRVVVVPYHHGAWHGAWYGVAREHTLANDGGGWQEITP